MWKNERVSTGGLEKNEFCELTEMTEPDKNK